MRLSDFRFQLPEELIAQYPSRFRDDARMMVLHRTTGDIEHLKVGDIASLFDDGDLFIANDTKVFPARLYAKKEKTLANIEVFLLRELQHENRYWDVLVDPARKIRIGNKLFFDEDATIIAEVVDNTTSRGRTVRFLSDYDDEEFIEHLYGMGITPLPKYIIRPMEEETLEDYEKVFEDLPVTDMDVDRYQSVFAKYIGAVAAPASSLHLSKIILKKLEIRGVEFQTLTSHVGLGNFKAIEVEDLTKFKSDSEQINITQAVVDAVNTAHTNAKQICAVGTEVMRALEHVVGASGHIKAYSGWTSRFIYPPYDFSVANAFLVNFYMPISQQLIMTAAFAGYDNIMHAYDIAVQEGYRFGDYGDAMLILD